MRWQRRKAERHEDGKALIRGEQQHTTGKTEKRGEEKGDDEKK